MKYYLNMNVQQNGDHEIHKESCAFYQLHRTGGNYVYLGTFGNDYDALYSAKRKYPYFTVDGCYYCCKSINKH